MEADGRHRRAARGARPSGVVIALTLVAVLSLGLSVAIMAVPRIVGGSTVEVASHQVSSADTDLAVVRPVRLTDIAVGDVIASECADTGDVLKHQVAEIVNGDAGVTGFLVEGAQAGSYLVEAVSVLGRIVYNVPSRGVFAVVPATVAAFVAAAVAAGTATWLSRRAKPVDA